MEKLFSTNSFEPLNFNLKSIIFSFLIASDQRKIYWSNKKLRKYLPDSSLAININSFKKRSSFHKFGNYKIDEFRNTLEKFVSLERLVNAQSAKESGVDLQEKIETFRSFFTVVGMLELTDGRIACLTKKFIIFLKTKNQIIEIESFLGIDLPSKNQYLNTCPCHHDDQILFTDGDQNLIFWDKNFNPTGEFSLKHQISSICNISQSDFAVGINGVPNGSPGCLNIFHKEGEGYSSSSIYFMGNVDNLTHHSYSSHDYVLFSNSKNIFAVNLIRKNRVILYGH